MGGSGDSTTIARGLLCQLEWLGGMAERTIAVRTEKTYEKYAWILLFALGMVALAFGIYYFVVGIQPDAQLVKSITGTTWNELVASEPGATAFIMFTVRVLGLTLIGFGVFAMAVASVPFRRGERWAWYVSLYIPVYLTAIAANNLINGGGFWLQFVVFLIISLLGLLLPYRKFFPRKQP